jgi:hypothetical protein
VRIVRIVRVVRMVRIVRTVRIVRLAGRRVDICNLDLHIGRKVSIDAKTSGFL